MTEQTPQQIRKFDTGATRDTLEGKLNFVKTLSPLVMERYVQYIGEHRLQSDGSIRNWDNWKNGIPQEVYLEGEDRHHRAVWKLVQGFPAFDNHGPVTLEDSLCGVLFNAIGMLHEILKEKNSPKPIEDTKFEKSIFEIEFYDRPNHGWYISVKNNTMEYLRDDLKIHSGTGFSAKYPIDKHEPFGYYPTKEIAEAYAKAYEEKN